MAGIKIKLGKLSQTLTESAVKNQSFLYMLLIVLIAFLWRIWGLQGLPKSLSDYEINVLTNISDIVKSHWSIAPNNIFNALYLYMFAIIAKVIGYKIFIFRIVQVLIGTLTVYLFYLFSREWFNRQVALLASLFLAVDAFHVAISREIDPSILVILFFVLILYLLTIALRNNKVIYFILAGLVCGLSLYVDKIFIFLPITFILSFFYFYKLNNKIWKAYWKNYLLFGLVFLVTIGPFIYFLPENINFILNAFNPGTFGQYFMNLGVAVKSLIYESIPAQLYYVGLEPILSPFVAICFLCGLVYACFHLERRKYFFLVILILVILGVISFSAQQSALNYLLLLPIAFILASVILDYFLSSWLKTFPFNKTARIALALALSFFVFLTVYYNFEKYFDAWGKNQIIQKQFIHSFEYKQK